MKPEEINGKMYQPVEDEEMLCTGCSFDTCEGRKVCLMELCQPYNRDDNLSVKFIEIKE